MNITRYLKCYKCGILFLKNNNKQRFCGSRLYKTGCSEINRLEQAKIRNKINWSENGEKYALTTKKWRLNNKERYSLIWKKWRKENIEKVRASNRKSYHKNKKLKSISVTNYEI